jgi:hypothetical protein
LHVTLARYRCDDCGHVAPGPVGRRRIASEDLPRRSRLGARRDRVPALDRGPDRGGARRVVELRERLLDMVEGRSKAAFKTWLAARPAAWRDGIEVVAMDGFSGFKTATTEELSDAVAVMNSFHVVRLGGDALDDCRRRVQQATLGHRGHAGDPLSGRRDEEPAPHVRLTRHVGSVTSAVPHRALQVHDRSDGRVEAHARRLGHWIRVDGVNSSLAADDVLDHRLLRRPLCATGPDHRVDEEALLTRTSR